MKLRLAALLAAVSLTANPASAAQCGGDFNRFVDSFSREAQGASISQGVISQAKCRRPAPRDRKSTRLNSSH